MGRRIGGRRVPGYRLAEKSTNFAAMAKAAENKLRFAEAAYWHSQHGDYVAASTSFVLAGSPASAIAAAMIVFETADTPAVQSAAESLVEAAVDAWPS